MHATARALKGLPHVELSEPPNHFRSPDDYENEMIGHVATDGSISRGPFPVGREELPGVPDPDALRYSGLLGETAIEVRGSALVNVTVDHELGLVTIRTPDTTIRLKKTE